MHSYLKNIILEERDHALAEKDNALAATKNALIQVREEISIKDAKLAEALARIKQFETARNN